MIGAEDFMACGRDFPVTVSPLPERPMVNAALGDRGAVFSGALTKDEADEVYRAFQKRRWVARNLPWWRRLLNRMRREQSGRIE
jgi:hypothetical protein